jgi:hypothetical protein
MDVSETACYENVLALRFARAKWQPGGDRYGVDRYTERTLALVTAVLREVGDIRRRHPGISISHLPISNA